MNWEDTVMNPTEIMDCQGTTATCDDNASSIARIQAQLTGDIAKQEGIKEVAEWVDKNYPIGTPKWESQKKKWGL